MGISCAHFVGPKVPVKCRTAIKALFLYLNVCLSVKLDRLSWSFTSIAFLFKCSIIREINKITMFYKRNQVWCITFIVVFFIYDDTQNIGEVWTIHNKGNNKITELRTILKRLKVNTHKYINRQNQSTTGKLWKP